MERREAGEKRGERMAQLARGNSVNSRRKIDRHYRDVKVALFYKFSRKIGQNQKSAIVTACSIEMNMQ
jgi:alkylation response protein AidB-like acyl-CoA dehydrogenase